ncbi:glycosyltransferase family 4 protein [Vitreoscilla filiformis]|jgi:glycosyltransferase involved in cell wall biosynthesis|uniref:glycosyltransferase family 4 protein n=1 Tax=Vitreoscilla filiformis TaxID=63 RepID=UPI000B7AA03B|nr:glycosyltransferase family 4 protein [Vitreoscilla filiformis]
MADAIPPRPGAATRVQTINIPSNTPPHRVVMVSPSPILGGIENHVLRLAQGLRERGHTVAYASPGAGWLAQQMRAQGFEGIDLRLRGMYDAWGTWCLARFARRWGATVLHGHAQRGGRYAHWAARWSGVPDVVTAHSTNSFRWFRPGMRLLAVSHAVRNFLLAQHLPPERVAVVYNGMPDPGEPVAPTPSATLRLGLIGRLEEVKGQDVALEALARLPADRPVQLQLVGADSTAWAAHLRTQVQRLGLADRVQFLGQRSDVAALLTQMDAVLAPSRREALSLTLVEAAAAGRPAIASHVGGIPEVVRDGVSGWLVPPDDPPALAQAIARLAALPAPERAAMGAAARRHYLEHFTQAAMVSQVISHYDAARATA